jgi:hypothetical protein
MDCTTKSVSRQEAKSTAPQGIEMVSSAAAAAATNPVRQGGPVRRIVSARDGAQPRPAVPTVEWSTPYQELPPVEVVSEQHKVAGDSCKRVAMPGYIRSLQRGASSAEEQAGLHMSELLSNDTLAMVSNLYDTTSGFAQIKRRFNVNVWLTPTTVDYFRQRVPDVVLVPTRYTHFHDHPILHIDREIAEAMMYDFLIDELKKDGFEKPCIIDIGGNPARHLKYDRKVHCCCPVMDANDVIRRRHHWNMPQVCKHFAQECECVQPDAYMAVDSLYYLSPVEIAELCLRAQSHKVVATLHQFPGAFGSFGRGESTYQLIADNMVCMLVNGNQQPYIHSNMSWMHGVSQCAVDIKSRYCTLVWSIIRTTSDHTTYLFTISDVPAKTVDVPSYASVIESPGHYGKVFVGPTAMASAKELKEVKVDHVLAPSTTVWSYGKWFVVWQSQDSSASFAPKGLVADGRQWMVGKPRTYDTFANFINFMRNAAKKFNIPTEFVSKGLFLSCCLAFVSDVEAELGSMSSVLQDHIPLFETHKDALSFKFPTKLTTGRVMAAVGAVAMGFTAAANAVAMIPGAPTVLTAVTGALATVGSAVAPVVIPAVAAGLAAAAVTGAALSIPGSDQKDFFKSYRDNRECNMLGGVHHVGPTRLPSTDPTCSVEELLGMPIDKSAGYAIEDPFGSRDTNSISLLGIGCSYSTPIICSNSGRTILSASIERGLAPQVASTPDFDQEFYEEFSRWVLTPRQFEALFGAEHIEEENFLKWNSKFPKSQQEAQLKAKYQIDRGLHRDWIAEIRNMIAKAECQNKATVDGVLGYKPRMIQGGSPHHNAATGPWFTAFSKYLAKRWAVGNPCGPVYATGTSAEAMGEMFSKFIDTLNLPYALEGDFSMFDTTVHKLLLMLELKIAERLGAPRHVLEVLRLGLRTKGFAKYGFSYFVEGTRRSGDPQTSVGNTMLQVCAILFLICKHHNCSIECAMDAVLYLALGDDSNILGERGFLQGINLKAGLLKLGFRYKPKVHLDDRVRVDSTFCSSVFIPVKRVSDGQVVTIMCGLPGKVIAKYGWYANVSPQLDPLSYVHGDALSREHLYRGVPFLRHLVRRNLALSSHVEAKGVDMRHKITTKEVYEACDETFEFFEKRYGITRSDEATYGTWVDQVRELPAIVNFPPIERMMQIDGAIDGIGPRDLAELGVEVDEIDLVDNTRARELGLKPIGRIERFQRTNRRTDHSQCRDCVTCDYLPNSVDAPTQHFNASGLTHPMKRKLGGLLSPVPEGYVSVSVKMTKASAYKRPQSSPVSP